MLGHLAYTTEKILHIKDLIIMTNKNQKLKYLKSDL